MRTWTMVIIMVTLNTMPAKAQTSDEWFQQDETQIRYLLEQIGALQTYGHVVVKGYDLAKNGLSEISGTKKSDYLQHASNFLSLFLVKEGVLNYSKLTSIYEMETAVLAEQKKANSLANTLTAKEHDYVKAVLTGQSEAALDLTSELEMVLTNYRLELKDDERIRRIDKIYSEMLDHYQFCRSFMSEIKLLVLSRQKDQTQIGRLSLLY